MSADGGGLKFDGGKTDWTYVQPQVIEKVVLVFDMGAKKYGRGNYQKGIAYSRLFSAAMRHLWAWWKGEEKDSESGLSHLYHAAWNILVLIEFSLDQRYVKCDDRKKDVEFPKPEPFSYTVPELGVVEDANGRGGYVVPRELTPLMQHLMERRASLINGQIVYPPTEDTP